MKLLSLIATARPAAGVSHGRAMTGERHEALPTQKELHYFAVVVSQAVSRGQLGITDEQAGAAAAKGGAAKVRVEGDDDEPVAKGVFDQRSIALFAESRLAGGGEAMPPPAKVLRDIDGGLLVDEEG